MSQIPIAGRTFLLLAAGLSLALFLGQQLRARPVPRRAIVSPAPAKPAPRGPVVCLDPGHPSEVNAGRQVQHHVTEVQINWEVANRLRRKLEQRGIPVVLTKKRLDEFVTNRRRAGIANAAGSALFFRLHCDTGTGSGITTYYPDRPGQARGKVGPTRAICTASAQAARIIHPLIARALCPPLHDNGIKTDRQTAVGRRQGALTGSRYANEPALTVEMVFLSNARDAAYIGSAGGQDAVAAAMAAGIARFLALQQRAGKD